MPSRPPGGSGYEEGRPTMGTYVPDSLPVSTGYTKPSEIADVTVRVESDRYGPVEDIHLILNHILHDWISTDNQARIG